jgi:hypothetical protein
VSGRWGSAGGGRGRIDLSSPRGGAWPPPPAAASRARRLRPYGPRRRGGQARRRGGAHLLQPAARRPGAARPPAPGPAAAQHRAPSLQPATIARAQSARTLPHGPRAPLPSRPPLLLLPIRRRASPPPLPLATPTHPHAQTRPPPQVGRIALADRCGSRMPAVRACMAQKIGAAYRGLDLSLDCYPDDDVEDDAGAYLKVAEGRGASGERRAARGGAPPACAGRASSPGRPSPRGPARAGSAPSFRVPAPKQRHPQPAPANTPPPPHTHTPPPPPKGARHDVTG